MSLTMTRLTAFLAGATLSGMAFAGGHHAAVMATDQSVAGGAVTAEKVVAETNGWLVVHRTDKAMKPGPVIGHAPLKAGPNADVAALLIEPVEPGQMLMLMVHGEAGGQIAGMFEYTLGAKEDGPIRKDGKLVMAVITAE